MDRIPKTRIEVAGPERYRAEKLATELLRDTHFWSVQHFSGDPEPLWRGRVLHCSYGTTLATRKSKLIDPPDVSHLRIPPIFEKSSRWISGFEVPSKSHIHTNRWG